MTKQIKPETQLDGDERRYSHDEVQNAAGVAAEMAGDPRFDNWMEQRSDALNGWSGYIFLTIRVAPMIERIVTSHGDGWEDLHFYDMLPLVADVLFDYAGDYEDEAALYAAIAPKLGAEVDRLHAEYQNDPTFRVELQTLVRKYQRSNRP
jgi:hypothetical protein